MSDDNIVQGPWLKPKNGTQTRSRKTLEEIKYDFEAFDYYLVMGWKHPVIPDPQVLAVPIRPKKSIESIFQRYREPGGVWLDPASGESADGIQVVGVWFPWPPIVVEIQKVRKKKVAPSK